MTTSIRKWWRKLAWQCQPGEVEECRAIWHNRSLDEVAQQLCNTRLRPLSTRPFIGSVEQSAGAITQAPSVWAFLEEPRAMEEPPANDALQWLLDKFLYGKLASLKLLQTGETIPPCHILASCTSLAQQLVHIQAGF